MFCADLSAQLLNTNTRENELSPQPDRTYVMEKVMGKTREIGIRVMDGKTSSVGFAPCRLQQIWGP